MTASKAELGSWLTGLTMFAQRPPAMILDGLDELQPATRSDIIPVFPRVKIPVTSRFAPDAAEVWGQVSLVPFFFKRL